MKSLILTIALLAGCAAQFSYDTCWTAVEPGVGVVQSPVVACDAYYMWVPGYWNMNGRWVSGYYTLRPGYYEVIRDHRVYVRRGHGWWGRP